MFFELKPIASLKHERGKKRRHRKRTPTGTANRILAPADPQTCPVDITGRYQSTTVGTDAEGWPMNLQINQAGTHIEFQLAPALTSEQAISADKWILFGGGDFNPGSGHFEIWFYEVRGFELAAQRGYEPKLARLRPTSGTIEPLSGDEIELRVNHPEISKFIRPKNVLGRFDDRPTPFTQSIPGLVKMLKRRKVHDHVAIAAGALWWPLLRYQKALLEGVVPQLKATIRAIFEAEGGSTRAMADQVFNLEKRLILTLHPRGDFKWHPLDVPLCRLALRQALIKTTMKVGKEEKPVLVFMDEAVRLFRTVAAGATAQRYEHPVSGDDLFLFRPNFSTGYHPEITKFVTGTPSRFRYKAKLVNATEFGADVGLVFGANILLSGLVVEKFQLSEEGTEKRIDRYEFVIALLGGSAGVGLGSVSFVVANDDAVADSPYDWDAQDFSGPLLFGELGAEGVVAGGAGLSEEGLLVFGNDPTIPFPLQFDFGDITFRAADPGDGGLGDEIDPKAGFSIDAGLTLMVGWLVNGLDDRDAVHVEVEDLQLETPLDPNAIAFGFDFGSALLNKLGRDVIAAVAARELYALVQPRTKLAILAHADLPDTPLRNLELTDLRAKNVLQCFKDYLGSAFQVDPRNVVVFGQGDLLHFSASGSIDTNLEDPQFRRADIKLDGRFVTTLRGGGRASVGKG